MALLFMDGFDHYGAGLVLLDKWSGTGTGSPSISATKGRFGARAVGLSTNPTELFHNVANSATLIVGFVLRAEDMPYSTGIAFSDKLVSFQDAGTDQILITLDADDGKIHAKRGGTVDLGSSTNIFDFSQFHHVEVKVTVNNTTGSVEIRVDGVVELNLTSQDTQSTGNAFANRIEFYGYTGSLSRIASAIYDDVYILDTTGSKLNNFIGDRRITAYTPDNAGNYADFTTVGSASNWQNVDEIPPNDDSDYNHSATATHKDAFSMDPVTGVGTIDALQELVNAKKSDSSPRSMQHLTRISSTDYNGASIALTTAYIYHTKIWEDSPDTAVAWTEAEVDGAEFGVEVV